MAPVGEVVRPADNPFASHRLDRLEFRPQGMSWDTLLGALGELGWRAAVVGPEGSGKTTLLEALAHRLGSRTHLVRIIPGTESDLEASLARLRTDGESEAILLIDGAERLGRLSWWRLRHRTRRLAGLVITAHVPGRLPTLIECTTSPELLHELVRELAAADLPALEPTLHGLFERHAGNLRLCLRELYDLTRDRAVRAMAPPATTR